MAKVLIVDDDEFLSEMLVHKISKQGHQCTVASTLALSLKKAREANYDVILLDVNLPDGNGLTILPQLTSMDSAPEIIIMTGIGTPNGAELAINTGAWGYLGKDQLDKGNLLLSMERALQYREGKKKVEKKTAVLKNLEIIGSSPELTKSLDQIAKVACTDINVLLTGETGSGKELFAKAIHENSQRADKIFVVVDCASLPETLVESTLFGHKKGSFTGAEFTSAGLIKQADGGTLFLDEIGEMNLTTQKKFLRAIQERCFRKVGGDQEETSNFRLISATNKDLMEMVKQGTFREDLFYRIQTATINLPPLRKRLDDIKELTFYFTNKLCRQYGLAAKEFSSDFFDILSSYQWPGNIRELINAIEVCLTNAGPEPVIYSKHLPENIRVQVARASVKQEPTITPTQTTPAPGADLYHAKSADFKAYRESSVNEAEKSYLENLMKQTGGNLQEACHIAKLGRTRLYTLLKKHKISRLGWPGKN
ncbi:MAG: sigma-54 dependent transcriptional regulator [Desulfobulbaceae bacterium]|nr:sigma-54 dependent transcriptional regulator [Desulfobulbaceae bacterium]HIJ78742.1 sigma-54-dependent Fis family transcriptional regulator [Deltaproteobacteria bacterium]